MGLNPRGRGRGRGGKGAFPNKGRRGGGMGGKGPMFRAGPPGMFCPPPMGFPPEPPFGAPFFAGPSGFNFGPPRPGFGKFPRKNFKKKIPQKTNEAPVPEIDLTKPWVTEEIKTEDAKKQECLETWRKSKDDEDWNKYKAQKQVVKNLYDQAKGEYLSNHPEEASLWQNFTPTGKYYCETCDKLFRTDDDYILHEAEHETCGKDGCQYTAHPKLIAKHIRMQHDTGLYKRIGNLYTKEEIAKWIEERKKRYPSQKVIEEKKALEEEKLKRGEKIKNDNSKFNKAFQSRNKGGNRNQKNLNNKAQKNRRARKKKKGLAVQFVVEEEIESQRKGVPAFLGIGNVKESEELDEKTDKEKDLEISDEEWVSHECQLLSKPILNNSLGLLASAYDSDEEFIETESQKENKAEVISDGDEPPDEIKTIISKVSPLENCTERNKTPRKRKHNKKYLENKRQRNDSSQDKCQSRNLTLLEKLLRKEIIHERNVILQCVHYIVKNNFFANT